MNARWEKLIFGTATLLACAKAQPQYLITTFAGGGLPPSGMAATVMPLGNPSGLAFSVPQGTLYVTALNSLFKIDTSGVLTRIAGTGRAGFSGDGGAAIDAQLNLDTGFTGIAVDSTGTIYISDTANNRVRKITVDGHISTVAGDGNGTNSGDGGPATAAGLASPTGIALDSTGQLYIATSSTIRKVSTSGVVTTIAGNGLPGFSGDEGPALNAQLSSPSGVAFDAFGNLYIADSDNNRIRMVTPAGTITTVAGNGNQGYAGDGGTASLAELSSPTGLAVDTQGDLIIADDLNNCVRKRSTQGVISTVAGDGSDSFTTDGVLATATGIQGPLAVAVDANGNLYVADSGNRRIREVSGSGLISTVAGNGVYSYSTDGVPATSVFLGNPEGVTVDTQGNVYIADSENNRVRMVSAFGTITTYAGDGSVGNSGDGGLATLAQLWSPNDVLMGTNGNLYIAVGLYGVVRMVSSSGTITTVAGNTGFFDIQDGGSPTATGLSFPDGLAQDIYGNLYIADPGDQRVLQLSTTGLLVTVAGNGLAGYAGDGELGVAALFHDPSGVAVDRYGNIFIADTDNSCIREVNSAGTFTFAGRCTQPGYAGDGGPASLAKLNSPYAVAVDSSGDVWIADSANSRIRMVSPAGIISTVAGSGTSGYTGDGGPATSAQIGFVVGLSIDNTGRVFLADSLDGAIRVLVPTSSTCTYTIQSGQTGITTNTLNSSSTGGGITIDVATQVGCGWTVGSVPSWLSVDGSTAQSGPGSLTIDATANTGSSRSAQVLIAGTTVTFSQIDGLSPTPSKIGAYNGGYWTLDENGNFAWDGTSIDSLVFWSLGQPGEIPVYGDWNGDGRTKVGLYVNGTWLLDYNGNGVWDGPGVDKLVYFGGPGYTPLVGDWNGSGTTKLGVYQDGTWLIDYNGNFQWDGPTTDKLIYFGGPGYTPVLGDWNGSGTTKIGVYQNGTWLIDYNGNFQWDGIATDKLVFFGGPGYTPVVGDWNGSKTTKIGAYNNGLWLLDYNGNFQWDGPGTDQLVYFGGTGYLPVVGDWNGSGTTKIAAYLNGLWVIDVDGNFMWDPPTDKVAFWGGTGQIPIVGKW